MTGGSGLIATNTRPLLAELGWQLRLLDATAPEVPPGPNEEFVEASILDRDAVEAACRGVDLVIHLAALSSERPWADILSVNIDGTQRVLDAAQRAGVTRVLFASSVHAVGFLPLSEAADDEVSLPRPDTYYGVSKAAGEALASLFADRFGMTIVSARIISASTEPLPERGRVFWFSPADVVRLFVAVSQLEGPGHRIVWGVSRGGDGVVDLSAGRAIGFDPVDDETAPGGDNELPGFIGGTFTELPLGGSW